MLTTKCIHPELIKALADCGHGDKILIADANYPLKTKSGRAQKIYLGLTEGIPTVTEVLEVIKGCINIEKAEIMSADIEIPAILIEFRKILPDVPIEDLRRFKYYDACCEDTVVLAISTGERRTFANILITVGVA